MISRHASWTVDVVPKVHMGSTKMCPGNRAVRETIGSREYIYTCTVVLYCMQYQTCANIMLRRGPCLGRRLTSDLGPRLGSCLGSGFKDLV
jgi:hypothetical protein